MIFGLNQYIIKPKTLILSAGMETEFVIVAKTAKSAWGKFSTQHFGALKPARKDYTVNIIKSV